MGATSPAIQEYLSTEWRAALSLTREEILASRKDRKPQLLKVPEWGGTVYIKHLTVQEQMSLAEVNERNEMPIAVLLAALVDENETPIFTPDDASELRKDSFSVILRVFAEVGKLNGLTTKELDEAMASFAGTRKKSGSSDSPSPLAEPSKNSQVSPVPS